MNSRTRDALQHVQWVRKAVLCGLILALTCLTAFIHPPLNAQAWEGALKIGGLLLIVIAVVGRAWCSLYIGGRKRTEIVDLGPYSISRNPLYVFSILGAVGIGAQTSSMVIAGLFGVVTLTVFHFTVKHEEACLSDAFGEAYAAYRKRTPRFWPDFTLWREAAVLDVRPRFFLMTIWDGAAFLLALPIFWVIDHIRLAGWTTPIFILP